MRRPRNRTECPEPDEDGVRRCPWAGCRYSLLIDVTRQGRIVERIPVDRINCVSESTCALDHAEGADTYNDAADFTRGGDWPDQSRLPHKTLQEVGDIMGGISRQAVSQIERSALKKLRGSVLGRLWDDHE